MSAEVDHRLHRAPGSLGVAADEVRLLAMALAAGLGTFTGLRFPAHSFLVAVIVLSAAIVVARWNRAKPSGTRRVVVVVVLVVGVTSVRGSDAARAYQPLEAQSLLAEAVIRADPEPIGAGWRAELQLGSGERLEATAFGPAAFELRQLAVGDRILALGRVQPIGDRPWLRARHVVGRLALDDVDVVAPATGFDLLVNGLRSVIVDGASTFDDRARPLYTGLVIGDDRFQSLSQKAQFRASGLTHLLAVSGQNVAFVLLVVRPLLLSVGRRTRFVAIIVILVIFAAMTRAEPSVLRASTAAGVATWSLVTGRLASGLRTLSVGVTGLLLIDPFLLDVVAFRLSVAASAGIIVVSPLVLYRLPAVMRRGRALTAIAQALAVTVGAQLAVAPLLIHQFGPLPLASIPANLAAGWAAGLVMTLGLTAGPISGLLHRARFPTAASILQWPSRLLVDWVDTTARWSADLDLPRLDPRSLAALTVLVLVVAVRPRRSPTGAAVAVGAMATAAIIIAGGAKPAPDRPTLVGKGVLHIPAGATDDGTVAVLVVRDAPPSAVDAVLASGVDRVDVVITQRGDATAATMVVALVDIVDTTTVLAPPRHRIQGASKVTEPIQLTTPWGVVAVVPTPAGTALAVDLPPAATPAAWAAEPADP